MHWPGEWPEVASVRNLISNVMDYRPGSSLHISHTQLRKLEKAREIVQFRIADRQGFAERV